MGMFGTGPSQPISGLPPANPDRRQPKREQPKDKKHNDKQEEPHREQDRVELKSAADESKSRVPHAKPSEAPQRPRLDLQG
jgi:hypothetical protein